MILKTYRQAEMARITSLDISWFAGYFACSSGAIEHDNITVYRSSHKLKYKVYRFPEVEEDYCGGITLEQEENSLIISKELTEAMFALLEQADMEDVFDRSYEEDIMDGSAWEIRIRYADRTIRRAIGNISYPPYGEELESLIRTAILDCGSDLKPQLFVGYEEN